MSKPSAPPAPDYAGAAYQQGAVNADAAQTTARMNNPSFSNPYGTRVVSHGWTFDRGGNLMQTENGADTAVQDTLSPAGQQMFEQNQQTQMGLGNLAHQGISQVQGAMGHDFNVQGPQQVQSLSQGNFQGGPQPTTNLGPQGGGQPQGQPPQNTLRNMSPGLARLSQGIGQLSPNAQQQGQPQGHVSLDPASEYRQGPPQGMQPQGQPQGQFGGYLPDAGQVQRGFADVGNNQRSLDYSGAPSAPQAQFTGQNDPVTQAIIQRNQPMADRQRAAMQTQLANQGIPQGSEAWRNAQDDFGRQQNDFNLAAIQAGAQQQNQMFGQQLAARQQGVGEIGSQGNFTNTSQGQAFQQAAMRGDFGNQAQNQAFSQGLAGGQFGLGAQQQAYGQQAQTAQMNNQAQQGNLAQQQAAGSFQNQARQQAFGEQAYQRALPLNEVTALMSGSQVGMPQFQQYQGANIAPAPLFNAAQAQGNSDLTRYNIQQGGSNNFMGGLFGLGAGAMAGGMFNPSDRRLKSNIKRVGTHHLGIGIYEYDIYGRRERGVMADEVETVRPEAVATMANGYKAVNYSMLEGA